MGASFQGLAPPSRRPGRIASVDHPSPSPSYPVPRGRMTDAGAAGRWGGGAVGTSWLVSTLARPARPGEGRSPGEGPPSQGGGHAQASCGAPAPRSAPRVRGVGPAVGGGAGRPEPGAGPAGRGRASARPRCWTTCGSGPSGCRVARAAGVESEMELAFAGLHQLCAPMLGSAGDRLPGPQRPPSARPSAWMAGTRPIASSSAWRCSGCCPRWPGSSRSSAWSTTRSGSTGPRRRRSPSLRAGSWPSRWRWCSWFGSPATSRTWPACPSWWSRGCDDERRPCAARRRDPGAAGRAGARPDHRRDTRQPARAPGAAPGADRRGAGGRVRASGRAAPGEPHRAELQCAVSSRCRRRRRRSCSRRPPSRSAT